MKSWSRQQLEAEQKKTGQVRKRIPFGKLMLGPEDYEQAMFFAWVDEQKERYPILKAVFAIPNGSNKSKTQRAVMQVTGLRPGAPDVLVSVAAKGYHGFYIEFKSAKGRLSPEQKAWIELLTAIGYRVDVIRSWIVAANEVIRYLGLPLKTFV